MLDKVLKPSNYHPLQPLAKPRSAFVIYCSCLCRIPCALRHSTDFIIQITFWFEEDECASDSLSIRRWKWEIAASLIGPAANRRTPYKYTSDWINPNQSNIDWNLKTALNSLKFSVFTSESFSFVLRLLPARCTPFDCSWFWSSSRHSVIHFAFSFKFFNWENAFLITLCIRYQLSPHCRSSTSDWDASDAAVYSLSASPTLTVITNWKDLNQNWMSA